MSGSDRPASAERVPSPRHPVTPSPRLLLLLVAAGGCGEAAKPGPAGVSGAVTFAGRPLAGGVIVFAPDRDRGTPGKPVSAALDADGRYRLTRDGVPAVPPGWYRVAIADSPRSWGDDAVRLPPPLKRPDRSGLAREVRAGRENVFDFHVELVE